MNRLISNITDAIALLFSNRLFVQALLAIAFVSIVFFILDNFDLGPFEATYYKNKLTIKFTIFSVIAALGVSAYLQSGATGLRQTKYYSEDSFWIHQDHSNSKISKIELSLNELQTKLNEQTIPTEQTEEEKSKLRSEAIEKITQETLQDIFKLQTIKLTESLKKETKTQRITELTNGILDRLRREISDLRLRSNTNLTIGMLITAGGLYLLWSTVSMVDSSELLKQLASEVVE
jgi:hypothetical protein